MKNVMKLIKGYIFVGFVMFFMCVFMVEEASAASKYYIKVNKRTNVATVYITKTNKPYKAFLVSCGNATPIGTFYTPAKYRWRTLVGPVYGQYCTRITGSILFHSVWYYKNGMSNTMSYAEYNKLGTTCSHGCVRLNVESAKWIYDNCSLKTKVIIFNGTSKNDPLGKPVVKKVDASKKMGWDPTDPNKNNPYNKISILGVTNGTKSVKQGSRVNILKGVSSKTNGGRNLTSKIKTTIKVPGAKSEVSTKVSTMILSKVGTYIVSYNVTDSITKLSKKIVVKYIVKKVQNENNSNKEEDNSQEAGTYEIRIEGYKASGIVEYMSELDIKTKVCAYNGADEDITDMILIEIKGPGQNSYTSFEGENILFDMTGEYTVRYKVWNPVDKNYTTQSVVYNCVDTQETNGSGENNNIEDEEISSSESNITEKIETSSESNNIV